MKLSSILDKSLIFYDIKGKNREEIYYELLHRVKNAKSLDLSVSEVCNSLTEREDSINFPYERGFAYPHLRIKDIDDLYITAAVLPEPVRLKENDIDETSVVFMFLISGNTSDVYLMTISAITKLMLIDGILEEIRETVDGDSFLRLVENKGIKIKSSITAEDIMKVDFTCVYEDDTVQRVLDLLGAKQETYLPVLDKTNKFLGVVNALSLIKKNVPKYMMMLDNFDFLKGFEPFENLINFEDTLLVKDFLEKPEKTVTPDVPLIQIALSFIKENVKRIFVVDSDKRLCGVVTMKQIVHKVLRG